MTFDDSQTVGDDILSALREDGRVGAPDGARARVSSRLGVGLLAGAATVTHASAVGAVAHAAGSSAAPVAGGALGFSLVNAVGVHPVLGLIASLSVGTGVMLGVHQAFAPKPEPVPVATSIAEKPAPNTPKSRVVSPTRGSEAVAVEPSEEREPKPTAPGVRPSPSPALPALVPAPDLPGDRTARLAEQQALLDQARASLRSGDGARTLAIVGGHQKLYPKTEFAEEREAIEILALVMVGRGEVARARGEDFAKRFPTSLFLPSIRAALTPPSSPSNETRVHE